MFRSMVHTVQTEVMTGRFANCDVSVCFIEATGAAGNQSRACRENRQLGSWRGGGGGGGGRAEYYPNLKNDFKPVSTPPVIYSINHVSEFDSTESLSLCSFVI